MSARKFVAHVPRWVFVACSLLFGQTAAQARSEKLKVKSRGCNRERTLNFLSTLNSPLGPKGRFQSEAGKELSTKPVGSGFFFGLVLTLIFTFRFFIEYTKDIQVDFESGMFFNMGQLLSLPFIILGIMCMKKGK